MSTDQAAEFAITTGDATHPQGSGPRILVHVVNDAGAWGKGFVLAVSARWRLPEQRYREWAQAYDGVLPLGNTQLVQVEPQMWVANMVAQHGIRWIDGQPPIRYVALFQCLSAVARHAGALSATVHMPRIGCGLAGGDWNRVSDTVHATLCARGVSVTVYDLPRAGISGTSDTRHRARGSSAQGSAGVDAGGVG